MSRIGVYGGSFNPVHNGHVKLAKAALDELNLDKVLFVPSFVTPLRGEGMLPATLRVKMLREALKGDRRLEVSTVEIERKGLSFTVDTLKYLKARHGAGTVLYFLSGADKPSELRRWKSWNEIPKLCRFIVMSRPGHPVKGLPEGAHYLQFDALDVSSTEIREKLKAGKSVRGLMPDASLEALAEYGRAEAVKRAERKEKEKKLKKKSPKKGVSRSKQTKRSK
jgi:nicotinate-nucleotide adenylyltransferase